MSDRFLVANEGPGCSIGNETIDDQGNEENRDACFDFSFDRRCHRNQFVLAGIVNTNVLPAPTALSTQIFPPCCSTICFAIDNPSPAPRCAVAGACQYGSKIRSRSDSAIPGPVSDTENRTSFSANADL